MFRDKNTTLSSGERFNGALKLRSPRDTAAAARTLATRCHFLTSRMLPVDPLRNGKLEAVHSVYGFVAVDGSKMAGNQ